MNSIFRSRGCCLLELGGIRVFYNVWVRYEGEIKVDNNKESDSYEGLSLVL